MTEEELKAQAELEEQKKKDELKEEFVSRKAYTDVSADMHKYKNELKDAKAALNQINAEKEAAEKERLAESGKWQELAQKLEAEKVDLNNRNTQNEDRFLNYHKKQSVISKTGDFKQDEYHSFIKVENIVINEDNSIDEVSLNAEVDRIKQAYPELLKGSSNTKLPNDAARGSDIGNKTYKEMTSDERMQALRDLRNK